MDVDTGQIVSSLIGSSPVAGLMWLWLNSERNERKELLAQFVQLSGRLAEYGEKTADRLDRIEKQGGRG